MVYEFQFHLSMHFQDLHPILAGEADNIPGRRVSMKNEYHLIHYVRRGCGTVYTDRGTFHAHAGQIIYIRPGESTSFLADTEDPWAYRWMGFDGVLSHRFSILPTIFDAPPGTFDDLCDIRDRETQVVEYKLLSELYFLFSKLLPLEDKMPPNYTQQIIDHIQTHYMEPLTVSGIADGFGLNRSYLTRKFKKDTGYSIQDYLHKTRHTKALHYLEVGYTVKETAALCGYSNASAFCKIFKRADPMGLTPQQRKTRYATLVKDSRANLSELPSPIIPKKD